MDVTYHMLAIIVLSVLGGILITWKNRGPP